jgi:hypothetical protein
MTDFFDEHCSDHGRGLAAISWRQAHRYGPGITRARDPVRESDRACPANDLLSCFMQLSSHLLSVQWPAVWGSEAAFDSQEESPEPTGITGQRCHLGKMIARDLPALNPSRSDQVPTGFDVGESWASPEREGRKQYSPAVTETSSGPSGNPTLVEPWTNVSWAVGSCSPTIGSGPPAAIPGAGGV